MELLALVLFNLVFGVILYFIISIKVTNSVRDHQISRLKKEIQTHTLNFFKESESYLALMDSRITIFKNLLDRAETMGIDFHKSMEAVPQPFSKPQPKQETPQVASAELLQKFTEERDRIMKTPENRSVVNPPMKNYKENTTEDESTGMIGWIGKLFRSILGIPDPTERYEEMKVNSIPEFKAPIPAKNKLDVSVGGNPLLDRETIQDRDTLISGSNFKDVLGGKKSPVLSDKVSLSPKSALSELSPGAPKVEKVVHLLKKGFSHSEISEELGMAIPEISLIETIKLERNRRI